MMTDLVWVRGQAIQAFIAAPAALLEAAPLRGVVAVPTHGALGKGDLVHVIVICEGSAAGFAEASDDIERAIG